MNPNTGEYIAMNDLAILRETNPAKAGEFSVELSGSAEDVEKVSAAVRSHYDAQRAKSRARNKAARTARRSAR